MQRIANGTQVASLPTAAAPVGTPGYGTNGDPGSGLLGSIFGADEFNPIQEEIMAVILGAGLTPDRADLTQLRQAILALVGHGRLLNVQIFATPGTFTYTPTTGTSKVEVLVQGSGGGGGGAPATGSGEISQASHGAAGSWASKLISSGFAGVTVTVPAGGNGGNGVPGGDGAAASFGALLSAGGGGGGLVGGPSAVANMVVSLPTPAALPTTGDLNVQGPLPGQAFTAASQAITQSRAYAAFGASFGAGGASSAPNSASTAAKTGAAGGGGIVIVREYS